MVNWNIPNIPQTKNPTNVGLIVDVVKSVNLLKQYHFFNLFKIT